MQHHGFQSNLETDAEEPQPGGAGGGDEENVPAGTEFLLELVSKAHDERTAQSEDRTLLATEGLGHSILAFSVDLQRLRKQDLVEVPSF